MIGQCKDGVFDVGDVILFLLLYDRDIARIFKDLNRIPKHETIAFGKSPLEEPFQFFRTISAIRPEVPVF